MQELRYGVIGTGMMGCEHLRNLVALPGVRVTAVADPVEQSRDWAASALQGQAPFASEADYRDVLARDDVDAVVIVTPNHTHAAVVRDIYAQRPDLHVMIEKPLCTTVADCQSLIDGARTHRGIVWVGLEYRYMPPVARFLHELRQPEIGDLKMLAIREHRFPFLVKVGDWNRFSANTGGTLVEKCCHFFDLMNLAVGARPVRVLASGGQDHNHLDEFYETPNGPRRADILDNAYVIVEYANGVRTMLDLCMFAEGGPNEQELVATGTLGKVEAFVPSGEVRVGMRGGPTRSNGASTSAGIRVIDASHDERVNHMGFHHGASYLEHVDFAAAIRNNTPPLVTLDDGLWSVAVGVAAHRSIEERRPIDLVELGLSA
jgi:myo-inositol 2-dehydrogenase / D-chiro-inositol 1-dehydrogenase